MARFAAFAAALAIAFSLSALAQEEENDRGPYPRPHIVSEGIAEVRDNGVAVRYYVSETDASGVDSDGDGTYYVLYEPPIYLATGTSDLGELGLTVNVAGDSATLEFHFDDDRAQTERAIRESISGTFYADAVVTPLFFEDSWFEVAQDSNRPSDSRRRSQNFRRQGFEQPGARFATWTFDTSEDAAAFALGVNGKDPNGPPLQLNFLYTFWGVSRDVCNAEVSSEEIRNTSRFKDLEGTGSSEHVTRGQLVDIADEVFRNVRIETSCRSVDAAGRIVDQALTLVGSPTAVASWAEYDEFASLSANDFAANVVTALSEERKTVARDQLRDAVSSAVSEAQKVGGAVGWGPLMAALSVSLAEASQEARSKFEDHLRKSSISYDRQGTEYTPKDIDVYLNETIVSAWQGGVSVRYVDLDDRTGDAYTIPLTRANWAAFQDVASDEGLALQARIAELENSMTGNMEEIRARMENMQASGRRHQTGFGTRMRRIEASIGQVERSVASVESTASANAQALSSVRSTAGSNSARLGNVEGAMSAKVYSFNLDETNDDRSHSHYRGWADRTTDMDTSRWPLAFIGNWLVWGNCNDESVLPPVVFKNNNNSRWVIAFDVTASDCDWLTVQVVYASPSVAVSNVRRLNRDGGTYGPSLR